MKTQTTGDKKQCFLSKALWRKILNRFGENFNRVFYDLKQRKNRLSLRDDFYYSWYYEDSFYPWINQELTWLCDDIDVLRTRATRLRKGSKNCKHFLQKNEELRNLLILFEKLFEETLVEIENSKEFFDSEKQTVSEIIQTVLSYIKYLEKFREPFEKTLQTKN